MVAAAVAMAAVSAMGQTTQPSNLTWDTNNDVFGIQPGSGTWDTGQTDNWNNGDVSTVWHNGDFATFVGAGGAYSVTIAPSGVAAAGVVVDGAYAFAGPGALTASTVTVGQGGAGVMSIGAGSVTVTGQLSVDAAAGNAVELSGGSLSVGTLNTNGTPGNFHWTGGNLSLTDAGGLTVGTGGALGANVAVPGGSVLSVNGNVTVGDGGVLSGNGAVASAVVLGDGGTLSPGSSVGTLTVSALDVGDGSNVNFELGDASDHVIVTTPGGLNLAHGTFNLASAAGMTRGTYTLIDYTGSYTGSVNALGIGVSLPGGYVARVRDNLDNTSIDAVLSASSEWAVDASGTWGMQSNWSGLVPDQAGDVASFGSVITQPRTVFLDSEKAPGRVAFDSSQPYTLAGPGRLTPSSVDGSPAQVVVASGSHTITTELNLSQPVQVSVDGVGSALTLSGPVTGTGPLLVSGNLQGTVSLTVPNSYEGGTVLAGATLEATSAGALGTGAVTIGDYGTLSLLASGAAGADVTILNGTAKYRAAGAAGGHRISASAVDPLAYGVIMVGSGLSDVGLDTFSVGAYNAIDGTADALALLNRNRGGQDTGNVTLAANAVVGHKTASAASIADLGTAADLYYGVAGIFDDQGFALTIGPGTPWKGISSVPGENSYLNSGTVSATGDFTLSGLQGPGGPDYFSLKLGAATGVPVNFTAPAGTVATVNRLVELYKGTFSPNISFNITADSRLFLLDSGTFPNDTAGAGALVIVGHDGTDLTLGGTNDAVVEVNGVANSGVPTGVIGSLYDAKSKIVIASGGALNGQSSLALPEGTGILLGGVTLPASKSISASTGGFLGSTGSGGRLDGAFHWNGDGFIVTDQVSTLTIGDTAVLDNSVGDGVFHDVYSIGYGTLVFSAGFNADAYEGTVVGGNPLGWGGRLVQTEGTIRVETTIGNRWAPPVFRMENNGSDVQQALAEPATLQVASTRVDNGAFEFFKSDTEGGVDGSQFLDVTAGNTWILGPGGSLHVGEGLGLTKTGTGDVIVYGSVIGESEAHLNITGGDVTFMSNPGTQLGINVSGGASLTAAGGAFTGGGVRLDGGTFYVRTAGATVTALGADGGVVDVSDGASLSAGALVIQPSGLTKTGAGTMSLPAGVYVAPMTMAGGTLNVAPGTQFNGTTFRHLAGSVAGMVRLGSVAGNEPELVIGAGAVTGSYQFLGSGSMTGNVPAGVSVEMNANGSLAHWDTSDSFTNAGLMTLSSDSTDFLQATLAIGDGVGTLTNTGTFRMLPTTGLFFLDGTFVNAGTGVVDVRSSVTAADDFTNAGTMNVGDGGAVEMDLGHDFHMTGGSLTVAENATVSIAGGTFDYTGGTVTGKVYLFEADTPDVTLSIGTTSGSGHFEFGDGGTIVGNVPAAMMVTANGPLKLAQDFTNDGTMNLLGTTQLGTGANGTFHNAGTATFAGSIGGTLENSGMAVFDGETNNGAVINSGSLTVLAGTSHVFHNTYEQTDGATTAVQTGGFLDVIGDLNLSGGDVVLAADSSMRVTGTLRYTGGTTTATIKAAPAAAGHTTGQILLQNFSVSPIEVADGLADVDLYIDASIASPSLTKTGPGTLFLAGDNSGIIGAFTVEQGVLAASSDKSLGGAASELVLHASTFRSGASFATARTFRAVDSTIETPLGADLTLSGLLTGSGTLTKAGAGALVLDGTVAGISVANVTGGTLALSAVNALAGTVGVNLGAGTTLDTGGVDQALQALSGTGSVLMSFGNKLTVGGDGADSTFAGNISGEGYFVKTGQNTVQLTGNNTYTADTLVNQGVLELGSDTAIPATSKVTIAGGAILNLFGHSATFATLTGSGDLRNILGPIDAALSTTPTVTFDTPAGQSAEFTGIVGGDFAIAKTGGGTQTLSGLMQITEGITVYNGTLVLPNANSNSGGITLKGVPGQVGVLAVRSDAGLGAAFNAITLDGGRLRAYQSFTTNRDVTVLSGSSIDVTAGNTLEFGGTLMGSGALAKVGDGALNITSANPFGGQLSVLQGNVALSGTLSGLTGLSVAIGTSLTVQNPGAGNNDRISDTADVALRGGAFTYTGAAGQGSTETLGRLVPMYGGSKVEVVHGAGGTATLTFGEVGDRGPGATMNIIGADLGGADKVMFVTAPTQVAGDPVAGSIGSWATVDGKDWAKYSASNGIVAFAAADYSADTFATDTHVKLTHSPAGPIGNTSIRTLNLDAGANQIDVAQTDGTSLLLSQGGLLKSGANSASISGGTITATNGELDVYTSGGDLRLGGSIGETVVGTELVKSGDGTLILGNGAGDTVANTYSGLTRVHGGVLVLDKAEGTFAIPGSLEISGGTILINRPGQINPNATVTLTGGTFDLNGQSATFSQFSNDGGTLLFNHGTMDVDGITLISGTTIVASELVAGSFMTVFGGDNQVHGLVTVTGTTTFDSTLSDSPSLTIFAGAAPGKLTVQGSVVFQGTTGTASILSTTPGAGETFGLLDLGNGTRTFNISDGTAAVDMRISARIQSGALTKSGAGTLRLETSNTYAGGTIISAGTLEATDPGALGIGPVSFTGSSATLTLRSDASAVTFGNSLTAASNRSISVQIERNTVGTTGTFTAGSLTMGAALNVSGATGGTLRFPGDVALQANATINNSVGVDFEGVVSGSFGFTKTLTGTLILGGSSPNTYTGATTVTGGILQLGKTTGPAVPGNLTIAGAATVRLTAANQIADSANVVLNAATGSSLLDLNGNNETINALTMTAGGTVQTGLGTLTVLSDTAFTGATGTGRITGKLALGGAGARTISVADGALPTDMEIAASISGSQGLVKTGAGRLLLSGINTFTGGITVNQGVVDVTNDSSIANNTITLAGGTLTSSGTALSAPVALNLGTNSNVEVSQALTLTGGISGSGNVSKIGSGVLTLTGANSLSGLLAISGGTLQVSNAAALGNVSSINVGTATLKAMGGFTTARPVSLTGGATFDVPGGATLSLTGGISGSGTLNKMGLGTLALGAPITTTGLTTLSGGAMDWAVGQTLTGGLSIGAATLNVSAPSSIGGPFTSTGGGTINHKNSSLTIDGTGNTSLAGSLRIAGLAGGSVTFARTGGSTSVTPGASITVDAGATLGAAGSVSPFSQGATAVGLLNNGTFNVTAGSHVIASLTGTGTAALSGGSLTTSVLRQSSLTISGGAMSLKAGATTSLLNALTISGSGLLDLADNDLVIDYDGSSPFNAVRFALFTGRNGGAWNGTGLTSSVSAADPFHQTALALVEASQLLGITGTQTAMWEGVQVDATSLLVKYTFAGDANLNGRIDFDDYAMLDSGYAKKASGWQQGDFDYSGFVTASDYLVLDTTFAAQAAHAGGALSPELLATREAQFGPEYVSALLASVPEPSMAAVGLIAAVPALARRRRRVR